MKQAKAPDSVEAPGKPESRQPRPMVAAIVLAAGLSTRMGLQPKLLLDVGGMPMVRRTVENALGIDPVEVIVVTGHRRDAVETALAGLPVRCVFNPAYADGQQGSVATGVRALARPCDAVMIMLGDQPLVSPAHLRLLVAAYANRTHGSIIMPVHGGNRGNPVMFAAQHIPSIVRGEVKPGCRKLIEDHPGDVVRFECEDSVFTRDCDTPEDYALLTGAL